MRAAWRWCSAHGSSAASSRGARGEGEEGAAAAAASPARLPGPPVSPGAAPLPAACRASSKEPTSTRDTHTWEAEVRRGVMKGRKATSGKKGRAGEHQRQGSWSRRCTPHTTGTALGPLVCCSPHLVCDYAAHCSKGWRRSGEALDLIWRNGKRQDVQLGQALSPGWGHSCVYAAANGRCAAEIRCCPCPLPRY